MTEIEMIGERPVIGRAVCQNERMNRPLRTFSAVLAIGLVLVACGSSADNESGATPATEPPSELSAEPAAEPATPATEAPSSEPTTDAGADAGADQAADQPAETEAPTVAEAAAPAEAVLGGRSFASELGAESDFEANVLPDLQVDDIRSGQKVNLRNVFPAERPVLFWMWAPH